MSERVLVCACMGVSMDAYLGGSKISYIYMSVLLWHSINQYVLVSNLTIPSPSRKIWSLKVFIQIEIGCCSCVMLRI